MRPKKKDQWRPNPRDPKLDEHIHLAKLMLRYEKLNPQFNAMEYLYKTYPKAFENE